MPTPPKNVIGLFDNVSLRDAGEAAEEIVMDFFRAWQQIRQPVDDLRHDHDWQDKEVDFRLHLHSGNTLLVEVKSDKHIGKSRNALFELCRIHHASEATCAYLGWSVFSESDRVVVWCPDTSELYIFWTADLRRAMQGYTHEKRKNSRIEYIASDNTRSTINILIPLEYVAYVVYQKRDGKWINIGDFRAVRGLHATKMQKITRKAA